jgi:hypothetical protein
MQLTLVFQKYKSQKVVSEESAKMVAQFLVEVILIAERKNNFQEM